MKIKDIDADAVFSALSDKYRRKVVELLHEQDSTLLDLAPSFPISFQALSKHIKVLESAQIILKKKRGKYRILSLNRPALDTSLKWISFYSTFWNESFDKLDDIIISTKDGRSE